MRLAGGLAGIATQPGPGPAPVAPALGQGWGGECVEALGFWEVEGLGFRVQGLGFRALGVLG